jgi:hypothetical protein
MELSRLVGLSAQAGTLKQEKEALKVEFDAIVLRHKKLKLSEKEEGGEEEKERESKSINDDLLNLRARQLENIAKEESLHTTIIQAKQNLA